MSTRNVPKEVSSAPASNSFRFDRVLVGLELGDTDEALLKYLDFFSQHFPVATAYFLHVAPRFDLLLDSEILDEKYQLSQAIEDRLKATVASQLTGQRIPSLHEEVREGSPLEELLRTAEDEQTELVMVGQKSLADSHGILAKKLARRAETNVLIVPSAAAQSLRKIMVPIDFSNHSAQALQTAVAMNQQLDTPADIIAMHVYEMPDFSSFKIGKTEEQFRTMIENDRHEALKAFVDTHLPEDQTKRVQSRIQLKARPSTARYLLDYARTQDVDFIVMGARGHSRLHVLFVGSVTEAVLSENKKIPTLIIR